MSMSPTIAASWAVPSDCSVSGRIIVITSTIESTTHPTPIVYKSPWRSLDHAERAHAGLFNW